MGEKKSVNFKSPVTWLVVGLTATAAVAIGVSGNRAGAGQGCDGSSRSKRHGAQKKNLVGDGFSMHCAAVGVLER